MKFKINVHKIEHAGHLLVEAKNREEAFKKAGELLDTDNNVFTLVVDSPSPAGNISIKHLQNIIKTSGLDYQFYFGDGLGR